MKNFKQILFLVVFIAGVAITQSATAQKQQQFLTDKYSVTINLTEYFGADPQPVYNRQSANLRITVEGEGGSDSEIVKPGVQFDTHVIAHFNETITVTLLNSNSYRATQTFYAVHQWDVFEMIIPAISPQD